MEVIIMILVFYFVFKKVKKSVDQAGLQSNDQNQSEQPVVDSSVGNNTYRKESQQELKKRLMEQYGSRLSSQTKDAVTNVVDSIEKELNPETKAKATAKSFISHAPNDPDHEHKHLNNVNPQQKKLAESGKDDILSRANKNTQNYAEDTLHESGCELHEESTESSLSKLEDLMICGYSGNLNFDRDFLAEATDMLNSYTL